MRSVELSWVFMFFVQVFVQFSNARYKQLVWPTRRGGNPPSYGADHVQARKGAISPPFIREALLFDALLLVDAFLSFHVGHINNMGSKFNCKNTNLSKSQAFLLRQQRFQKLAKVQALYMLRRCSVKPLILPKLQGFQSGRGYDGYGGPSRGFPSRESLFFNFVHPSYSSKPNGKALERETGCPYMSHLYVLSLFMPLLV